MKELNMNEYTAVSSPGVKGAQISDELNPHLDAVHATNSDSS